MPFHILICDRLSVTFPPIRITEPRVKRGQQEDLQQTWLLIDGIGRHFRAPCLASLKR
jgi:hypothetical protein